ncbi:MAG: tyrosine-type recombinase/integrase, partial [Candidatus Poribacteria bacterium]
MTTRALEDSEIKAIFENIEGTHVKRNETLLLVGIGMALRVSELVGLKVGDVYDNEKVKSYVNIRAETAKNKKERTIRIGDEIQRTINDFIEWKVENGESIEKNAPLFVSQKGGHLTRIALFQTVKKIFSAAGIEQSPHSLRKTGATIYYVKSDYDLIATQLFLGHADPSTTRRYIGLTTNQIVEYAERLSDHLFSVIFGDRVDKFNSVRKMLNFRLRDISTSDLILELQLRGIDISSIIEQLQDQREQKQAKVIPFPRSSWVNSSTYIRNEYRKWNMGRAT